jgi:hypothetical protein
MIVLPVHVTEKEAKNHTDPLKNVNRLVNQATKVRVVAVGVVHGN